MKITLSWIYFTVSIFTTLASLTLLGLFLLGKDQFSIDLGLSPEFSLIFDLILIVIFGLQHSVMARTGFKKIQEKIIPFYLDRATFNLISALILSAILILWQDIPGMFWEVESTYNQVIVYFFFGVGIFFAGLGVLSIRGADLSGYQRLTYGLAGKELPPVKFQVPFIYQVVRHPIYFGFLLIVWSQPNMPYHLFIFALGMTTYTFIGVYFEELSLVDQFGEKYISYKERVPQIIPAMRF